VRGPFEYLIGPSRVKDFMLRNRKSVVFLVMVPPPVD